MNPEPPQPVETKRMVCLANSRKLSGRCVAGREIVHGHPGAWVRPVSDREHQEVSEHERQYEDGSDPKVLDVIAVPLVGPRPHHFQQENWLLDPNYYWQKTGRLDWAGLQGFLEPVGPLWINGPSTSNGLNDRVVLEQAERLRSSLRLIHVDRLVIRVFRPGEAFNNPKRRVQGQLVHEGVQHWLWVTDPVYERRYLQMPDGSHNLGECCLTISLGEPHEGFCYKLIAAVIERDESKAR